MTKSTLQQQLETLSAARYPLHMPGHKRRVPPAPGLGCYAWDLTEIDGADDLHDADGILADAMARTAALYGARRCWYLVGGSTVGLLAGIRALAPFGSTVIAARNCHKAVYHAIELGQLTARWLTPPVDPQFGVYGSVRPADVAAALDAAPDARCVILTSPTYEGVLSDIRTIAEICHARGVPLLVDEAHGAHYLPFAARYGWRGGAVAAGADLVVQSAHKTLPSLTQTAFLQLNGDLADPAEVERQLDVFETSSPSYPLMVSLDGCTRWLADEGEAAFAAWRARLDAFDAAVRDLKNTKILCCGADALTAHPNFFAHDSGKILLQRYGDFRRGRRTTQERLLRNNIVPTLKDAVPGDLSLVFPHRIMVAIDEMIQALDKVTPGIASDETLLYGVEVKFYSNKVIVNKEFETNIKGLRVMGDGASITRGLQQASANGLFVARCILFCQK